MIRFLSTNKIFLTQGRVIKKAKRRNLNDDQKKNIFNSFGGFSSTNSVSASDAFSFLSAPASNGSSAAPVFGSLSQQETKTEEKTADPEAPPEEGKVDGTAPVDDIFAKFVKAPAASVPAAPTSEPNPPDDLFAKFLTKSSGKWTCDVCMITNNADTNFCVACESPRPGYKPPAPEPPTEQTQQVGTNGFKFGFTGNTSQTAETSSAASGFKFGSAASVPAASKLEPNPPDETQQVGTNGFKFGFTASQTAENSTAASGFKFGSDAKTAASEASGGGGASGGGLIGGFKFGSSTETDSKPSGGLLFGTSTETKSTGGFLFGMSTATDAEKQVTGGFQFGSSAVVEKEESVSSDTGKGFRFTDKVGTKLDSDASDTPKTKSKKGEYLSNLKSLNTQVTSWIKTHVDKNPLVDLTPVFKDYEKHIGNMRTKYNISVPAPADQVKDAAKVLSFGSSPSPFSAAFGSNQVPKPVMGFGQTTGFQFGMAGTGETKPENTEKEDEEEDDENSKKPADPVVEEDAIFSKKCKLYYKKADSYVERGKGNLHVKMTDEEKIQVVIRADTSLGNILLNTLVTASTPLERIGKKDVMLVTLPNPPIDPKAESEPVTFLVRVKSTEDADEVKQKLNDLCKN